MRSIFGAIVVCPDLRADRMQLVLHVFKFVLHSTFTHVQLLVHLLLNIRQVQRTRGSHLRKLLLHGLLPGSELFLQVEFQFLKLARGEHQHN